MKDNSTAKPPICDYCKKEIHDKAWLLVKTEKDIDFKPIHYKCHIDWQIALGKSLE